MKTPNRTDAKIEPLNGLNRYMNELFRIVNGALRLDIDKVRNYTAFLAEKLETAGDSDSAARLRKLLEETDHDLRPAGVSVARALPVDSESRFPLLEAVDTRIGHYPQDEITQAPSLCSCFECLGCCKSDATR